eukprot:TRINITY_DN4978_c0_g1_i2.p1 TRINITY_DN4978_c0_g1~~TRINITY_DN4978_c0_g1_i2.p1  ORF type:complete len:673 (-),score=136.02 TRINITY_DN4978_c0_g1_i2:117-2135(-)
MSVDCDRNDYLCTASKNIPDHSLWPKFVNNQNKQNYAYNSPRPRAHHRYNKENLPAIRKTDKVEDNVNEISFHIFLLQYLWKCANQKRPIFKKLVVELYKCGIFKEPLSLLSSHLYDDPFPDFPPAFHEALRSLTAQYRLSISLNKSLSTSPTLADSPPHSPKLQNLTPFFTARYTEDFEQLPGKLGEGGFGVVVKAVRRLDGTTYAIKKIHFKVFSEISTRKIERIIREVKALARLDSPNICRYFNAWIEPISKEDLNQLDEKCKEKDYSSDSKNRSSYLDSTSSTFDDDCKSTGSIENETIVSTDITFDQAPDLFFERSQNSRHPPLPVFKKNKRVELIRKNTLNSKNFKNSHSWHSNLSDFTSTSDVFDSSQQLELYKSKYLDSFSKDDLPLSRNKLIVVNHQTTESDNYLPDFILSRSHISATHTLFIQMQCCEGRTLQDYISDENFSTSRGQKLKIFYDIVKGLEHVHSKKLIHRDLKPSNIFFMDGIPKIGDFGLAKVLGSDDEDENEIDEKKNSEKLTGRLGTMLYAAPEQKNGKGEYDEKVDIYSLGIILFEMFFKFGTMMERVHAIEKLKSGVVDNCDDADVVKLILSMVHLDGSLRPSCLEILNSDVFEVKKVGVLQDKLKEVEKVVLEQKKELEEKDKRIHQLEQEMKKMQQNAFEEFLGS